MDIRKVLAPFVNFTSQDTLVQWSRRSMLLPFYHTISDINLPYISNLYPLRSVDQFQKDLDYFCKHFTPVDIFELEIRGVNDTFNHKPAFHLTFDDGLKECYSIIAPILAERGIPATFFLNTDFIDNKGLFYRYKIGLIIQKLKEIESESVHQKVKMLLEGQNIWQKGMRSSLMSLNYNHVEFIDEIGKLLALDFNSWLKENKPYLTMDQVKELLNKGFHIGSHSADHPRFKHIDLDQQKSQLAQSFQFLEDHFKIQERYFSFPFGDEGVGLEYFHWMYKKMNCSLSFGVSGIKDDYFQNHLHRIPMDNCHSNVERFIKTEYLYFALKSVFNKNQIKRN